MMKHDFRRGVSPWAAKDPDQGSKVTHEQFLNSLDEDTWAEWVDGEAVLVAPVPDVHQDLAGWIAALMRVFAEAQECGVVLQKPFQMKSGPDLPGRSPDIIFVSRENLGRLRLTHLEGPGDVVVEVVSPESAGRDRGEKYYEYERGGVREYWLIDPQRRQAEFYRLGEDGLYYLAQPDSGVFRSEVLSGFWMKLDWLWQKPLPKVVGVLKEWRIV